MKGISDKLTVSLMFFRKNVFKHPDYLDKLTVNDMAILGTMWSHLSEHEGVQTVGIAQISRQLNISKPATTQSINRLEDKGVVERVILKSDRRSTSLKFTEKGLNLFQKEKKRVDDMMEEVVVRMGENDTVKFIELLDKFKVIFEEISEEYGEKEKRKA